MANLLSDDLRVHRFLKRVARKSAWSFSNAPDKRQKGKIKHQIADIHWALLLGLFGRRETCRDAEEQTKKLGSLARRLVPEPISDTTLFTEAKRLDDTYLGQKLVQQIQYMHRAKMLRPMGVPCGVGVVDGKDLATLDHHADGQAHERSSENEKWQTESCPEGANYWLTPVLRCTLTSAAAKPCIYQMRIQPGTGESTAFPAFVDALDRAYGRGGLLEVIELPRYGETYPGCKKCNFKHQ
jgi:hypothetical protein